MKNKSLRPRPFFTCICLLTLAIIGYHLYTTITLPNNYIDENNEIQAHINSNNAYLYNRSKKESSYQKNSDEKIAPASLTKIMTAIIAIENYSPTMENLSYNQQQYDILSLQNASMAGFLPYEELSFQDALYGLLLSSGADAAMLLVNCTYGSEEAFVKAMNAKAKDLGMSNTHFNNSSGLDDRHHYSTAKDIAILLDYAYQNSTFQEVFTTMEYVTSQTNYHTQGIYLTNTMYQKMGSLQLTNGKIIGGKTGYTENAGLCLASMAIIHNQEYIFVSMNAINDTDHIQDAKTIYEVIQ